MLIFASVNASGRFGELLVHRFRGGGEMSY